MGFSILRYRAGKPCARTPQGFPFPPFSMRSCPERSEDAKRGLVRIQCRPHHPKKDGLFYTAIPGRQTLRKNAAELSLSAFLHAFLHRAKRGLVRIRCRQSFPDGVREWFHFFTFRSFAVTKIETQRIS